MMVQPSLALFTSQDTETNNFNTGKLDIEIDEEFDCTDTEIETGKKICTKEVVIENTISNIDAVIRVAIIPYWQDDEGNVLPEDVSGVTLHFSNVVDIDDLNSEGWVNSADLDNDGGQDDSTSDGYYYYNKLVKASKTTKQILAKVTIPEELLEDWKTLIVDVKAEAVQPNVNAIKDLWPNLLITGGNGQQQFNRIGQLLEDIIINKKTGGIDVEADSESSW